MKKYQNFLVKYYFLTKFSWFNELRINNVIFLFIISYRLLTLKKKVKRYRKYKQLWEYFYISPQKEFF